MRSRAIPEPRARVVLTERDLVLLETVFLHRALSRDHIRHLCGFGSLTRVNHCCRRLFDANYLRKSFVATGPYAAQTVYAVGTAAVLYVAARLAVATSDVRRFSTADPARISLEHSLLAADIRVWLQSEATSNAVQVVRYLPEAAARDEFEIEDRGRTSTHVLKPDGYVELATASALYGVYVEADRGNVSSAHWEQSLNRYKLMTASGLFSEAFGIPAFSILFVTTEGDRRIENLKRCGGSLGTPPVIFATAGRIATRGIYGAVWSTSTTDRLLTLVEALEAAGGPR